MEKMLAVAVDADDFALLKAYCARRGTTLRATVGDLIQHLIAEEAATSKPPAPTSGLPK